MEDRTCSVDDCQKPPAKRGWCSMHYSRWRRHGTLAPTERVRISDSTCSVDGCDKERQKVSWCGMHYARLRRWGTTDLLERPRLNDGICLIEDCALPQKSRGWCSTHYARWRRTGTTDERVRSTRGEQPCAVDGCPHLIGTGSLGMCGTHARRLRETGDPQADIPIRFFRQVTILKDMSHSELAWLAGWLEGEGCFTGHNNGGYTAFRITGNSTDKDVIDHILAMTGIGTVSYRECRPPDKPQWIWVVSARPDVTALATLILPFMHKRRGARIQQLLDWDGPRRKWTPVPTPVIKWTND